MLAYRAPMLAACLFRLLTILALVLMPIGMILAQPGQAHNQLMSAHCANMDSQPELPQPDHKADCAIACSALPSVASSIDAPPLAPALIQPPALSAAAGGLHPEAATPPPRLCRSLEQYLPS